MEFTARIVVTLLALVALVGISDPAGAETIYANDFEGVRAYDSADRAPSVTRLIGVSELENSGAVAIGPDGNLYVLDRGESFEKMDILLFSADGTAMGTFITGAGFVAPETMKFGPDGDLFVVDGGGTPPAVYRFDGANGAAKGAFTTGKDLNALAFGLAFDPTGRLYVSDPFASTNTSAIHRFNADGSFNETVLVDASTKASDLITSPSGICFGPDGLLYIVDRIEEVVFRYDSNDDSIEIYSPATNDPLDCAFGANGSLYVNVFGPSALTAIDRDGGGNAEFPVIRFATDLPGHRTLAIGPATVTPSSTSTSVTTSSSTGTASTSSSSTSTEFAVTTTTIAPTLLCGDFDGNGVIRSSDALQILRAAVGLVEICPTAVCDANGDGQVRASDALRVLQKSVGIEVELLCV
ncbi:MAG: sugar lactone lactonase YvrE [Hyphomicrobiaceae bacterium]|jgi:sugar lactone lactonase YvrE